MKRALKIYTKCDICGGDAELAATDQRAYQNIQPMFSMELRSSYEGTVYSRSVILCEECANDPSKACGEHNYKIFFPQYSHIRAKNGNGDYNFVNEIAELHKAGKMSTRLYNILCRDSRRDEKKDICVDFRTYVENSTRDDLYKIRNMGKQSLNEFMGLVNDFGYSLKEEN